MKMTVTKRQVLKAIQTEPLLTGSFIHTSHINRKRFKNNVHCPVCAVESIFSCTASKNANANSVDELARSMVGQYTFPSGGDVPFASLREVLEKASEMVNRQPLSALSSLFEAVSYTHL